MFLMDLLKRETTNMIHEFTSHNMWYWYHLEKHTYTHKNWNGRRIRGKGLETQGRLKVVETETGPVVPGIVFTRRAHTEPRSQDEVPQNDQKREKLVLRSRKDHQSPRWVFGKSFKKKSISTIGNDRRFFELTMSTHNKTRGFRVSHYI